jgi:CRP-like cAMP-binding protein
MAAPVDIRKLKDEANALLLKGKNKEAAAALDQVIKADKTDVKSVIKLGDVYKKLGDKTKAVEAYSKGATLYAQQGFLVNAISVNKMILELDPNHKEVQEALAGLYAKKDQSAAPSAAAGSGIKGASLDMLEKFKKKPAAAAAPAAPAPAAQAAPAAPAPAAPAADAAAEDEAVLDGVLSAGAGELEMGADDILAQLPRIPLFSHLTADEFIRIIDQLQVKVFEPGDLIISEGDHGDSFYVITRGMAVVTKRDPMGKEIEVAELGEGNFFGEFAFLAESDRRASVRAKAELEVLEFSRGKLDDLINEYPRVKDVMLEFYRERVMKTLLATSPLFQPFNEQEKHDLMVKFEYTETPKDVSVITEGTDGDGLYLIMNGEVTVTKKADGKVVELAKLREGEFFGEMSLLMRQKTTATVTTSQKTGLFKLPKSVFNEVILTHPQILEVIADFSDQRRQSTQRIVSGAANMAASGIV